MLVVAVVLDLAQIILTEGLVAAGLVATAQQERQEPQIPAEVVAVDLAAEYRVMVALAAQV